MTEDAIAQDDLAGDNEIRLRQALALQQSGRLAEAARLCEDVLAGGYTGFNGVYLLGTLHHQLKQYERATELIGRAIALRPDYAAAYSNLGLALQRLNRAEEALVNYDRAIALQPDYLEPHVNRAIALRTLGRLEDAIAACDQAIALRPDCVEAYANRGAVLLTSGRPAEALASCEAAIRFKPDVAEVWRNRGEALYALARHQDALDSYDRAIMLTPDDADSWCDHGNALFALRRHQDALDSYDRAVALKPDAAEGWSNRGNALGELGRQQDALDSYDRAIALAPEIAAAWSNRGNALRALNRHQDAVASCERAITLEPNYAEAHLNRGVAQQMLSRHREALASFDAAVAVRPDFAEAHWNKSLALLHLGRLTEGWELYEWRKRLEWPIANRACAQPLWLGAEDLRGRTILLHAEQGLGDTLQFCRYVPRVAALGARVVLEVQPGLERLLSWLEGVDCILVQGGTPPRYDVHTPLMSLPLALGASPDGERCPYLSADPKEVAEWGLRLGTSGAFRVGLCWAGGARPWLPAADAIDKRRSLKLEAFGPLVEAPGLEIYSLQKGPPAEQLAQAQARGWTGPRITDLTADLKDFADTAAFIANLDLVITCDTSIAHLAGGLGKPVWILNRFDACWRWLNDREDSPWYPSARLFRQTAPGDWRDVVDNVTKALLSRHSGMTPSAGRGPPSGSSR